MKYICNQNIKNHLMMSICENIEHIVSTLPAGVRLVAVSKTKPAEYIEEAYATAVVLIIVVFGLNLLAEFIGNRLNKKLRGETNVKKR